MLKAVLRGGEIGKDVRSLSKPGTRGRLGVTAGFGYFLASLSPQVSQDSFSPLGFSLRRAEFSEDIFDSCGNEEDVGLVEGRCSCCWRDMSQNV